jgi:hypothetical protein
MEPDLVIAKPSPSAFTTIAFDYSSRRWFETCSCKPVPRGLPSSVKQLRNLKSTWTSTAYHFAGRRHGEVHTDRIVSRSRQLSGQHCGGDFNGDGKLDLVTANLVDLIGSVTILLGDGTGNFMAVSSATVGGNPSTVVVGDFNGDGRLDLAVSNQTPSIVTILLGDGTGNFSPTASSPAVGATPAGLAVGDFNGDGKLDLATANFTDNNVTILLGDGTGNFTPTASSPRVGAGPFDVAVGDFNGDGKLDLAVANKSSNNVTILLGDGMGNFSPNASSATATNALSVAVGDFNGDGKLDLAVTNFNWPRRHHSVGRRHREPYGRVVSNSRQLPAKRRGGRLQRGWAAGSRDRERKVQHGFHPLTTISTRAGCACHAGLRQPKHRYVRHSSSNDHEQRYSSTLPPCPSIPAPTAPTLRSRLTPVR